MSPSHTENREHQARDTGGGPLPPKPRVTCKAGGLRLLRVLLRGLLSPAGLDSSRPRPVAGARCPSASCCLRPACLGWDTSPGPAARLGPAPVCGPEPHKAPPADADHRSQLTGHTLRSAEGQAPRGTPRRPSAAGSRVLLATRTGPRPPPRDACLAPTAFPCCLRPPGRGPRGRHSPGRCSASECSTR